MPSAKNNLIGVILLLASCQPARPSIQTTPPTSTLPTSTPPTSTPPTSSPSSLPTASPQATSSPVPTPTPDPEYPLDEDWYVIPQVLNYPVEVVAGSGKQGMADGPAMKAEFDQLQGLCADLRSGALYLLDGNRVRKLTPDGQVQTVAGTAEPGFKDGLAQEARFDGPTRCEVDQQGGVYLIDKRTRLRSISPDGQVSTLPYGTEPVQFSELIDLAISPDNVLHFTNQFQISRFQNNQFEVLNNKQRLGSTWQAYPFKEGDIKSGLVRFGEYLKIAFGSDGSLFIADESYRRLLKKASDDQVTVIFYNDSVPEESRIIIPGVLGNNLVYDQARHKLIATFGSVIDELDLQGRPRALLVAQRNADFGTKLYPDAAVGKDHHIYFIDAATRQIKRLLLPPP